jgi:uncharacterized protein
MSDAQYLYRIVPARLAMLTDGATLQEADAVTRHFAYLQELVQKGHVILAGRTLTPDEECFGIVIFRAASEAEALQIMRNDPAVREGVMVAQLFPYRIALIATHNAVDDEG